MTQKKLDDFYKFVTHVYYVTRKGNANIFLSCRSHKLWKTVYCLDNTKAELRANVIGFRAASCQLWSCGRNLLHDDRTNLAFANRAFLHAAPAVWNSLPPDIVSDLSCFATFKRLVKTELYNWAYLRWLVTTRTCDSSLFEWQRASPTT